MRTINWAVMLLFLSCVGKSKIPKDILDKEKLAEILSDIHMAEARVTKMNFRSLDSSVIVYNKLQNDIWAKYEIDSALYKKSYAFYASNPEQMTELYEIVTKRLESTDTTKTSTP